MAYEVYPVTGSEISTENYEVKINGVRVPLDTARVSAVPFNRRWPGHQRSEDQTELVNFLSLETDGPLDFEITPKDPFDGVVIRPQSLGVKPEIKDGVIRFTLERSAYFTVEPYGRKNALHIFADPVSHYGTDRTGMIYFGAGVHDAGVIELKSGDTLFIDKGALVYGCVHAIDAENIRIIGRGILDNSKNKEVTLYECNAENNSAAVNNVKRRMTVELEYCRNVEIDGITIRDSLVYNIRPVGCEDMRIANVKIIGCWRYNSDGIDMHNCKNVLIEDCFIRTFDDSICAKGFDCYYDGDVEEAVRKAMYRGGRAYDVFKNLRVRRCTVWNDWGRALEIGAETRAEEMCDIIFEDCDVIHVSAHALDCQSVDYADIHDVIYRNINVEYDWIIPYPKTQAKDSDVYESGDPYYAPRLCCVHLFYHPEYSAGGTRRGHIRDILFQNINLYGRQPPSMYFCGYDEGHKVRNVTVENVYWNGILQNDIDSFKKGDFTENIEYRTSPYAQMDKNTVSAENQLRGVGSVRFMNPDGRGRRIVFAGNSITLHDPKPEIGWYGQWGMAASAPERDYVHILTEKIGAVCPDASYCICQAAAWEVNYKDGGSMHEKYREVRSFGADVILMRFVENCKRADFEPEIFKKQLSDFLDFINGTGKAKMIMTTGFWRHPGDDAIRELAAERGLPCVELGDLGERDDMKATGMFEHRGVASHPGDLGMKNIADRVFEELKKVL